MEGDYLKNIVVLDGKTLGNVEYDKLKDFGKVTIYENTSYDEVAQRVKDAHIILTNKVVLDNNNLSQAENLELICETATGFNNIDIEYAHTRNIAVTNVAGYSTTSVIQHTFACALNLINKLPFYDNYVKNGDYERSGMFTCLEKPFYEIEGKVWGIVGLGNIGKGVAKVAEAFGAKVVYYSTSGINDNYDYDRVELEELLKESDIISIHAPLNANTHNLFNYENISMMKKSAILINMGRGPIVVEKDLAKAIDEELISGAALDVFEVEPILENNPLVSLKNKDRLLLTPHIAWASAEARDRLFNILIDNITAFYKGEKKNRIV